MDTAFLPALDLRRRMRERELSSRELLDYYLRRVERFNDSLNAIVTLDVEGAQHRADQADALLKRGQSAGPLHGLPVTIKDTIETAGIRTTAGFTPLADHVPAVNATAVQRLVDAGAIVFGKTNAPVLAGDYQSYNPLFGTTNNPWDFTRTPGGSSGGSAAALAAGLTALEVGSDIAGSIRVPAHWCGVYGFKPTHGVIPVRGHIPGPPGTLSEPDLAVVGPMARSARDLALAFELMAGPAADRARAWTLALPPARVNGLTGYRVAAWLDDESFPVDSAVRDRLRAAVEALRSAGVRVDEDARPALRMPALVRVYLRLLWPIMASGEPPDTFAELTGRAANLPEDPADHLARRVRYGTRSHRDWLHANEARENMRAAMAEFFQRYDVLLMPVNQLPAIRHDHSEPMEVRTVEIAGKEAEYLDLAAWTALATVLHLPAVSAPVGRTAEGLPVGIQIVAPYLEDRTAIDFAARMAEVAGGFEAPQAYMDV